METQKNETPKENNELDLVFCMDCTSSMSSYISAAQANIVSIVEKIVAAEKADVQFGLVAYRDHPPQDRTYVTKVFDFTSSLKTMQSSVKSLSAQGGGDGPEAVTAAMDQVLRLPYRKTATKICVLIADAPPHGLGESGDGFPKGDPDGKDPIQIANEMLKRGITVYTVGCEPALSNYRFATDFFDAVATITSGKFLPLTSAHLLADVIIGGAQEEIALEKLMTDLRQEIKQQTASETRALSEDELAERVSAAFAKKGYQANQLSVDDVYKGRDRKNADLLSAAASLSSVQSKLQPVVRPKTQVPLSSVAYASASVPHASLLRKAKAESKDVSFDRTERLSLRSNRKVPSSSAAVPTSAPTFGAAKPAEESLLSSAPMAQQVYNRSAPVSVSQVRNMMKRVRARGDN